MEAPESATEAQAPVPPEMMSKEKQKVSEKVLPLRQGLKEHLREIAGMEPSDSLGWLYVGRGMFRAKNYVFAFEAASKALNHPQTAGEATHICAFSLHHLGQREASFEFFKRSVNAGRNETDFQMMVELAIDRQKEEALKTN